MAQPYKEQVLRMRYYDEAKLVEYLDETLGAGIWRLKVRMDRWVLLAKRPLSPDELEELDKRAYEHY